MNRLQKKCFVASAGFHILLVAILMVGPAFLAGKSAPESIPEIDFIPSVLIEGNAVGGGNPNARPPAPQPIQPAAPVQPAPAPAPVDPPREKAPVIKAPEPEQVKQPEKTDPDAVEPTKKTRKPNISTEVVTRKFPKKTPSSPATPSTSAEELQAQRQQQVGRLIANAINGLGSASSTTTVVGEYGPGGGGPTYAPYAAWVKKVYTDAWVPPDDAVNENGVVKARVIINQDGSVKEARIIGPSNDSALDASVRRTLESVRFVAKFPEGAKDKERSFTISFNLKAKRGIA